MSSTILPILASDMVWRPALAPTHIAAAALALAALATVVLVRHWAMGPARAGVFYAMRLMIIGLLAALLMGPSRVPERDERPDRPVVCMMLDTSASMRTDDVDGRERIAYLVDRWLTASTLDAIGESFDVRLYGFDEAPRALTANLLADPSALADGRVSNYAGSLTETLVGLPDSAGGAGATVVVLGDGHDSDAAPLGPVSRLARERGVTIHTVTAGRDTSPPDVAVAAFPQQAFLLAGETGQIVVRIFQAGLDGERLTVKLTEPGGRVTEHPVRLGADGAATLELPITPEAEGKHEYLVSVDPQPGETVTGNNRHAVFVDAIRQRIRVLVLEGQPYWDTKFIAQSLRTDEYVELTHITQVSADRREGIVTRTERATADVPDSAEALAAYDVIVLGSDVERVWSPAMMGELVEYVSGGGHVVFARGRGYDAVTPEGQRAAAALAPIEPVTWARGLVYPSEGTRFELTPAGRGSPSFSLAGVSADVDALVGRLPTLRVMPLTGSVKPGAQVLAVLRGAAAGGEGVPAIAAMGYGRGRVFAVLGEGLWRWSFLPPRLRELHGVFDAFWSNTIRGLAMGGEFHPGQNVSLSVEPTSARLGDPVAVEVTTKFAAPAGWTPTLRVTDPDGGVRSVTPTRAVGADTRWRVELEPGAAGVWRVEMPANELAEEALTRRFSVYELDLERLRPAARPQAMSQLAERTGGLALPADSTIDLAAVLKRQVLARLAPPTPQYIWDRGWLMAALLVWAGLEWLGRRQAGWL